MTDHFEVLFVPEDAETYVVQKRNEAGEWVYAASSLFLYEACKRSVQLAAEFPQRNFRVVKVVQHVQT